MTERKPRAAVLGAGVMGTGIAAHLAGAGVPTLLLDIVPTGAEAHERSRLAQEALGRALKARPAPMFDPDVLRLVTPGNFDDHLEQLKHCDLVIEAVTERMDCLMSMRSVTASMTKSQLKHCDLVIEAVTERMDIKQSLLGRLSKVVGPHTIIASNTSGLSVAKMAEALPAELAPRFVVMHFFNPVRYMNLVEVVAGPKTSAETVRRTVAWSERLGKGVVFGKDTVNFVANRIGVFAMMHAIHAMPRFGLSIEEVDQIAGPPLARPASAAYRTADLVGIDTLAHVAANCQEAGDEAKATFDLPDWVQKLLADKRLGQKSGAGFYKKEGKDIQVLDPATLGYRAQKKGEWPSLAGVKKGLAPGARVAALIAGDDAAAKFAWDTVAATLVYAAARMGEIADDVVNIDRAMRWGFNWDLGPFELWDALGVGTTVARMKAEHIDVPEWVGQMLQAGVGSFYGEADGAPTYYDVSRRAHRPMPQDARAVTTTALARERRRVIDENKSATLLDAGDGVLVAQVHTKMNVIDLDVIAMIEAGIERAERDFRGLVLANDGAHFGAGFNLMLLVDAIGKKAWNEIDSMIGRFQQLGQKLRYASIPTLAAPFQYTFGGALELALATDAVQAHAESYMGLVEAGVGLVPGGGGCLRLLERVTSDLRRIAEGDLMPAVGTASLQIAMAKTSTGAHDARRLFYMREGDGISLGRDHQLGHAKARVLGMASSGYTSPTPPQLKAAGLDAGKTIAMRVWAMVEGKYISPHDATVARHVAHILTGGCVAAGATIDEQHVLDLEREAFLSLCGTEKTQARIEAMLRTGKPLRN